MSPVQFRKKHSILGLANMLTHLGGVLAPISKEYWFRKSVLIKWGSWLAQIIHQVDREYHLVIHCEASYLEDLEWIGLEDFQDKETLHSKS